MAPSPKLRALRPRARSAARAWLSGGLRSFYAKDGMHESGQVLLYMSRLSVSSHCQFKKSLATHADANISLFKTNERTLTTTSTLVTHTQPREAYSNLLRILLLSTVHYLTIINADIHPLERQRRSQSPLRRSVVRVSGHEQHTRQPSQRGFDGAVHDTQSTMAGGSCRCREPLRLS